jgi:Reverse transcriptase (RNA-dependent DNA polymerase)
MDFFEFHIHDGILYLPWPVPETIKCTLCKIGKYSSRSRVQDSIRHISVKHNTKVAPMYTCNSCDHETSDVVVARRHEKGCGGLDEGITVDGTTLLGNEVTLMYPGGPCRCPLCKWHTTGKGTVAFQSIEHHLFRVHGINTVRRWQCRKCEAHGDGYFIKTHYKTHLTETPKPYSPTVPLLPLPPNISNRELFRIINLELSTTSCHTPNVASRRNTPNITGREGTSPFSPPSFEAPSSASDSISVTSAHLSPSTPNRLTDHNDACLSPPLNSSISSINSLTPTNSSNSNNSSYESPASSPSQLVRSVAPGDAVCAREEFRGLWGPRIAACNTVDGLDSILTKCSAEWLKLSTTPEDSTSSQLPPPKKPPSNHRKQNNQNRQQQRIRRSKQTENDKKSKMQRLFSLYPRRAVRKILEEDSIGYSGTKDTATAFLEKTYCQTAPSEERVQSARAHFDRCEWKQTTEDDIRLLSAPPNPSEIKLKLGKAANTAPGSDGLEYRHLRSLDGNGELLATIYRAVWSLGLPACWKTSRTIPIFKKGDPSDYGNFRPISLLPTMYKIFSGIISSRIMATATRLGWISPEQKGFLPGVRGIQEHTHILHAVIEQAKQSKKELVIAWLDLTNAFGSIPHPVLNCLFESLPIPDALRRILSDIYSNNIMDFAVGQDSVQIQPTAGVRQGDPLSSVVFNLAAEPIIRTAKSNNNGFPIYQSRVSTTAYADDIAIVGSSVLEIQETLNATENTASSLGLTFNPGKCTSLTLTNGKSSVDNPLKLGDSRIRALAEDEQENYLGTPLGSRLTFRPTTSLLSNLIKVGDSGLAPWQKLEVFRSALLPSLSHHLASGRVEKRSLYDLDVACRDFLRKVACVPISANTAFFYADRRAGGLGVLPLTNEADIWTLARALQLLDSKDQSVSEVAMAQLEETIKLGYGRNQVPSPLPINEYLAGSMEKGLGAIRHGGASMNLWTRARKASGCLKRIRIDVSGEEYSKVIADDISSISVKAVRGLRTAMRQRWTNRLLSAQQGKVATGLALDMAKENAGLLSCRTPLTFQEWHFLHKARLGILPVRGGPGSKSTVKTCRLGCTKLETTDHVVCGCQVNSALLINRHNSILELIAEETEKLGHSVSVNLAVGNSGLRPDLVVNSTNPPTIIDVTVPLSSADGLEKAKARKIEKYNHLGLVLPLVVGSLGSWLPSNDEISLALGFSGRKWGILKKKMKLLAIQGTTRIIAKHLAYQTEESDHEPEEEEAEDASPSTSSN